MSNLQTRVITALVLGALVVGTLLTRSSMLWAALILAFCLAAVWEGQRLCGQTSFAARALGWAGAAMLLGLSWLAVFWRPAELVALSAALVALSAALLFVVALFWLVVAPVQLSKHVLPPASVFTRTVLVLLIGAAWLSAVLLQRLGMAFLVAVVVLTVVADVAAYFVGRAFGRHKLAPAISPGKTREGAVGGITAAALWSAAAASYLGLAQSWVEVAMALFAGAALGCYAVMGDLWESLLKRQAGVKDSSQLLPGHGGVLDRIDAQLAVLPTATLLISLVKPIW